MKTTEEQLANRFMEWVSGPAAHPDVPSFELYAAEVCASIGRADLVGGLSTACPQRGSNLELWAYELKLRDWKRALYQALRYRKFASRVCVVMPPNAKHLLQQNSGLFRRLGVGALVFDPDSGSVTRVVKARRQATGNASRVEATLRRMDASRGDR
jgi:hypothetical protein